VEAIQDLARRAREARARPCKIRAGQTALRLRSVRGPSRVKAMRIGTSGISSITPILIA
jgi:hypothetical protein